MNQQRIYHTFSLPKIDKTNGEVAQSSVPDLAPYAVKYSHLKLKGLRQNPGAFSSTVASELALSDEEKIVRVSRADRTIFVVEEIKQGGDGVEEEGEWAGQVVLVGPMTRRAFLEPFREETTNEAGDANEANGGDDADHRSFWHLTALYVDVDHRGRGLTNMLCEAAYDYIRQHNIKTLAKFGRQEAKEGEKTLSAEERGKDCVHTLRLIIKPDNEVVVKMYERMGFRIMEDRRATLAEALRCSDEVPLPADYEQKPRYTTRGGLIMIKDL